MKAYRVEITKTYEVFAESLEGAESKAYYWDSTGTRNLADSKVTSIVCVNDIPKIPEWAKWISGDEDGTMVWEEEPQFRHGVYVNHYHAKNSRSGLINEIPTTPYLKCLIEGDDT